MQFLAAPSGPRTPREFFFEIGDRVRLRADPDKIGIVVARSISANVGVLWQDRGVEQIDSSLLMPADWPDQ